jgi:hypothetical protein
MLSVLRHTDVANPLLIQNKGVLGADVENVICSVQVVLKSSIALSIIDFLASIRVALYLFIKSY